MQYLKNGNTIAVRLDRGDEILSSLLAVAKAEHITLAQVSGIGGTDHALLGVYDLPSQRYNQIEVRGTHEICSLTGNINTMNGLSYAHVHATMAGEGGSLVGGHLLSCIISLTAELFLTLTDAKVDRSRNRELGINTWDFDK